MDWLYTDADRKYFLTRTILNLMINGDIVTKQRSNKFESVLDVRYEILDSKNCKSIS